MKKLQNKIFIVIFSILTIFILTLLIIFNTSLYMTEYKETKAKAISIALAHEKFYFNHFDFNKPMIIDLETYVVQYDKNGKIKEIINYTSEDVETSKILDLINKNNNKINNNKLGNLYFNKYIFYKTRDNLIILNNSSRRNYLIDNIYRSITIFILSVVIIIYISSTLTKWLVKPVQDAFTKQKQFIYDASHELKTPIAIILASAEALEENKEEVKWLDNIKSESERMNKLVVNLLELSKSEEIDQELIMTDVNLSKIIKNKALSFESLMYEHHLELELNIEKDIIFKCHQEYIKELLSILLDNAIKHGYENSKIEVKLYKNKDMINLEVKNRGDEIKQEEREKIFERFYRGDKSRNRDTNRYGLGLAIAKNIVINHHGNIYCTCENGYTTFIVNMKQTQK